MAGVESGSDQVGVQKMTVPFRESRFYDKDRKEDQRNPFQRDRDRILYTSEFRRLGWVTQVVSSHEGEPFHNRLTHTLEVAQIGRRLAEKFLCEQRDKAVKLGGIDPEVVEAAALAHDLGHPPFGHNGEKQLHACMMGKDIPDGFEGNAQSFRIVTKLAIRHSQFGGLNLTRATLNAILKYPWLWKDRPPGYPEKWSAYAAEEEIFSWVRQKGPHDGVKCAEAEIMDLADDIAYAVHDVEDFYKAGFIPLERITRDEDEAERVAAAISSRLLNDGNPGQYEPDECKLILQKALNRYQITESYSGTRDQRAKLRSMTSDLIGRYVGACKLFESDSTCRRLAGIESEHIERELSIFKQLLWHYVIDGASLATQQYGQRRIIRELFDIFFSQLESGKLDIFPEGCRDELKKLSGNGQVSVTAEQTRIVADLIAGMTEQQAVFMHHRLTGVSLGSVMNSILY